MLRSGENDLKAALSSHRLRTGTKLLNERQGDQAVSSGLGVEVACSPCPTLHLGSFKAFLIAYLWSRPASSYIKHSSYTHRISPPPPLFLFLFNVHPAPPT